MIVKLLTEHYLECLSLKVGCRGSSQNATLLEVSYKFINVKWPCGFRDGDLEKLTNGLDGQTINSESEAFGILLADQ